MVGAVVAVISLAVFASRNAQQAAAETHCKNNLKQVGLALHNYLDTYSGFPPAHSDGHSWRIRITPYIWSSPQYAAYDFDQPWDAPHNSVHTRLLPTKKVGMSTPDPLTAYGHPYGPPCDNDDSDATSYVMLVGENAFGHPSEQRKVSDVTDGTANTIAVVEIADSHVHWLSPVDLKIDDMSFLINSGSNSISSHHSNGPAVLFCDGAVFRINPSMDAETVRALCTINGGEDISRETLISQGLLVP